MKPSQIVVRRTDGGRPLRFEGTLLTRVEGPRGPSERHEVRIYRTRGGRFVVVHSYRPAWDEDSFQAKVVPAVEWIPAVLAEFDVPPRIRS
ncbi:MAG: hypothetical protein N0A24_12300, partial [Armatimonadetes bacterium]|nr:hypothetical protein [Armatimonadota bacterium]MDW8154948.1 hypothetical protein [Armatimonadota bacterium]